RNFTLPVNLSDYIITSASVNSIVYANASLNIDRAGDTEARNDLVDSLDTYDIGDFVRFYVLISDLEKEKVYEIAHLQPANLGAGDPDGGSPPENDILLDTNMITVPTEVLIFYLSSVLKTDDTNFTLTLGMRLHFEDNIANNWDYDKFNELIIKSVNLTFTYEKKIDKATETSWNQIGDAISGSNKEITNATLNFKYKIDYLWPSSLSFNSEIKILLNNYEIDRFIKLSSISTVFQELELGGFEVASYILKNTNITLSIQVFIADEFPLNHPIKITVDDVFLEISYLVWSETPPANNNLIWIILVIALIVIALLASLSLRSYIILPRKQRKKNALLLRTQKFKDSENIQGILLIDNVSGLPIFSKNYSELMEGKNTLFSGFIQALSLVGEEISLKKSLRSKGVHRNLIDGIHNVIELDFKHFYCLISDIEELRTVLILNSKASKRLKRQLLNFGLSVYAKYAETLKKWDGDLTPFKEYIPPFINNYFDLHYKEFFKLTINRSDLEKTKKEFRLSRSELKVLYEILSIAEKDKIFKLITLLEKSTNKSEDLLIDSIEALIKKNLIIPADSLPL
ncbi:MAG: hypothetical protein ACW98D_21380, partial [Promethearchaeota archaeon]